MTYKQEPPFAVQIELVEGCNLRCSFCGLNGIRGKDNDYKTMQPRQLGHIIEQIVEAGWNPRIEFAMHGEPTMHPNYVQMIAVARKYGPNLHLMMTSNGGGLLPNPGAEKNIGDLFKAGLNVLALDNYENVKIVPKIMDLLTATSLSYIHGATVDDLKEQNYICFEGDNIRVYAYPRHKEGNPHMRRKAHERVLTIVRDISKADKGTHSRLANHAGAAAPLSDKMAGKRCAKPFREMSIRWNGNVAICCDDWRGVYKCGNVLEDGLLKVWHSVNFRAARRKLYHGMRDFGPCLGCTARSYRVGLLPDKKGVVKLPKPDDTDLQVIKIATSGDPYTKPVLRPWESGATKASSGKA
jgi:MoaA/NifB/PqqE/SkfB family radical SAM enzyme